MSDFKIDTSGVVTIPIGTPQSGEHRAFWAWDDLTPLQQGYVEAAFSAHEYFVEPAAGPLGFRHLAPETLAAMRKDCERFRRQYVLPWYDGAEFWSGRQAGEYAPYFPPVTLYLDADGKVRANPSKGEGERG